MFGLLLLGGFKLRGIKLTHDPSQLMSANQIYIRFVSGHDFESCHIQADGCGL
jgi:hypothetical protein